MDRVFDPQSVEEDLVYKCNAEEGSYTSDRSNHQLCNNSLCCRCWRLAFIYSASRRLCLILLKGSPITCMCLILVPNQGKTAPSSIMISNEKFLTTYNMISIATVFCNTSQYLYIGRFSGHMKTCLCPWDGSF